MKSLVDQINGILEFINKQNQVDEKSDTRTMFTGDSSLQSIEYRLRNMMHEGFPVDDPKAKDGMRWKWLNEMGVTFQKDGKLEFSEEKFMKSLADDYKGVSEAITGEYGFAQQMRTVMANFTRPGNGLLANREAALRQRIRQIDDQISSKERRIEQRAEALTNQFARLESTLNGMNRQQQYMSAMGMGGGGGNPIAQLLGG
jgi:flagellar hook-associated protein 2